MSGVKQPFELVGRGWKAEDTIFEVNGQIIGGNELTLIAGPCAVENEDQMEFMGSFISKLGIRFIRGGAFKPRTSPYSFQGLKKDGLKILQATSRKYGLSVVTEVMETQMIDEVYPYADIMQVGARNMKNYSFLKAIGKTDKPVLLKRGMDATLEEFLLAAEYILLGGNENVILCERGIRTFDHSTRNTFDISAIPHLRKLSHLPVFADPSQGTGIRELVGPVSLASAAAGANGIMIEVHPNPEKALSDGDQSLYPEQLEKLLGPLGKIAELMGKNFLPSQRNTESFQLK